MSGRPTQAQVQDWAEELTRVAERIGRHFPRIEPRQHALGYVRGLLSDVERKNGWQLAELLGEATPDAIQHLLARAEWDAEAVRDELLGYVRDTLGHCDGVLVVDETGFLKKGTKSAGVARQYSGTAGRIENCQVGVFLGYAGPRGRALLDRALYLPREWTNDKKRCPGSGRAPRRPLRHQTGAGAATPGAGLGGGCAGRWVTADSVYGSDYAFRQALEEHGLGYVVGVRTDFTVSIGLRRCRAKTLLATVPATAWHRLSCGAGAKGPRSTTGP